MRITNRIGEIDMKKNEYYIHSKEDGEREPSFKPVMGYKIDLSGTGFEKFHLFVHKAGKMWAVTEATTGAQFPSSHGITKREAIDNCLHILHGGKMTPEKLNLYMSPLKRSPFVTEESCK